MAALARFRAGSLRDCPLIDREGKLAASYVEKYISENIISFAARLTRSVHARGPPSNDLASRKCNLSEALGHSM